MTDKVKQMLDSADPEMVALGVVLAIDEMTTKKEYEMVSLYIRVTRIPLEIKRDLRRRAQTKHLSNIIGKR